MIDNIKISGTDSGLGFKSDGCSKGDILEPIEACPLTITWSPTRIGPVFDDVQILHDGARGVLVLPIRGEAIGTVSQDQKSIVLNQGKADVISSVLDSTSRNDKKKSARAPAPTPAYSNTVDNPQSVLDGYKITSFSGDRAIIKGPGGSRIVFNNAQTVLGGILWTVNIKREGIEFIHNNHRVLMLFDRSLSSGSITSDRSSSSSRESNDRFLGSSEDTGNTADTVTP